jgi:hypothetical protein
VTFLFGPLIVANKGLCAYYQKAAYLHLDSDPSCCVPAKSPLTLMSHLTKLKEVGGLWTSNKLHFLFQIVVSDASPSPGPSQTWAAEVLWRQKID